MSDGTAIHIIVPIVVDVKDTLKSVTIIWDIKIIDGN